MTADRSDDDDVRRLLAGADGPGPVPDDLVARISASLEAEEQRRLDADRVCRFDPAVEPPRRRQRSARALVVAGGTATAVTLLAVSTVPGIIRPPVSESESEPLPHAQQAFVPTSSATAPSDAASPTAAGAGAEPGARTTPFVVVSSGVDYHLGEVTSQVHGVTRTARLQEAAGATDAAARTSTGVTVSRGVLEACLESLSLPGTPVLVDVARFDGRSAFVVVTDTADDGRTVTVVPQDCGTGSARTLAGPYTVR